MYVWKKEFETGHPKVDYQHRQLFKAFLAMMEICNTGKKDRVAGTLDFLIGFTDKHIQDSDMERMLSSFRYPFQHHVGHYHEKLVSFVTKLEQKLGQDGPSPVLGKEIDFFVEESLASLLNHIRMEKESRNASELILFADEIKSDETQAFGHIVKPSDRIHIHFPVGFH